MLRKGQFTHQHFDSNLNFIQQDVDKESGKEIIKVISAVKPGRDLKQLFASDLSVIQEITIRKEMLMINSWWLIL